MGMQFSINEEVSNLLPEKAVDSVISSVETEVFKLELATNLPIQDFDIDLKVVVTDMRYFAL